MWFKKGWNLAFETFSSTYLTSLKGSGGTILKKEQKASRSLSEGRPQTEGL